MILQTNVAFACLSELRKCGKLAGRNSLVPFLIAFMKIEVADTINGNFTLLWRQSKVDMIPFSSRTSRIIDVSPVEAHLFLEHRRPLGLHWLVKLIQPTSLLGISSINVVLNLDFWTAVPRLRLILGHMKHDATVATF